MFVALVSRGQLPSPALRAVVAAPIGAGWVAQSEVGNNLADAQWFLVYAAFWAAVCQESDRRRRWAAAAVLFAAAASDPFTGLYLPLLRRRRIQAVGMAAGLAYQGIGIVFGSALTSRHAHRDHDVRHVADAYLVQVVGHVLWPAPGLWPIGAALGLGLLATAFRHLPRRRLALPATALGYSVLIYFALVVEGGFVAPRYAYLGTALLLAAITTAASGSGRGRAVLTIVVAVCVCWGCRGQGVEPRAGPSWRGQVQLAAARCREGHRADVDVPITPAPWTVRIPCPLLVTAASPATPSAPDPAPRASPAPRRSP